MFIYVYYELWRLFHYPYRASGSHPRALTCMGVWIQENPNPIGFEGGYLATESHRTSPYLLPCS
ncbi:hypothetical protein LINPERPRIM_LOCUS29221 [Linum perenne]